MAHGFKSGGRSIGTPNKTTADFRQLFADLLYANFDTLQADLSALEPKDRIRALIDISKFVVPTIKAIEIKEQDKEDNHFTFNIVSKNEDL